MSIVIETKEEEVPIVAEIMKTHMEGVTKPYENLNRVLLKTDIEMGLNLGDLEKYKF